MKGGILYMPYDVSLGHIQMTQEKRAVCLCHTGGILYFAI